MTITKQSYSYRNCRNNCTLYVCLVWEKFTAVAFWRVSYQYDGEQFAHTIRGGLLNKPTRTQINNYLINL